MTHALLLAVALAASPSSAPSKVREAAQKGLELAQARFRAGQATVEDLGLWSRRVRDAAPRSEAEDKAHLERTRALLALVQEHFKAGTASSIDVAAAEYLVADAEASASH